MKSQNFEIQRQTKKGRSSDTKTAADVDTLRQIMELLDLDLAHGNPSTAEEDCR